MWKGTDRMIEEKHLDAPISGMRFQRGRPYGSGSWPTGSTIATHLDRTHLAPLDADGWNPLCGKQEPPFGFTEDRYTRMHRLLCKQCMTVCLSGFGCVQAR